MECEKIYSSISTKNHTIKRRGSWKGYQSIGYTSEGIWGVAVSPNTETTGAILESATAMMVVANVVAFELPRAQYTNGPWVLFKGGELRDSKLNIDTNTYQFIQVGWDKNIGKWWNVGAFFEANWMYGRGTWRVFEDVGTLGTLKSTNKGLAGGLYISRTFRNKTYFDTVARFSRFDNDVRGLGDDAAKDGYMADWKSSLFGLGLEYGGNFTSRDGRVTFNPYNRLIYNTGGANEFAVAYVDGQAPAVANINGFGVWTNRLGARLSYTPSVKRHGHYDQACNPCDPCSPDPCAPCGGKLGSRSKVMYFVDGDWYKGICGQFGGSLYDPTFGTTGLFVEAQPGREKNDLSYGVASYGVTLMPRESVSISFVGHHIFGDISGYGVTASTKVSF